MPDLRLDYPDVFQKWQSYLTNFDMNKSLSKLPEVTAENEKYFITGKGIFSSYYNVKNLEQRLSKYTGEFIQTGIYEMEVSVNSSYADLLKIGGTVLLSELKNKKGYTGKVTRVNQSIDPTTQTISATIEVKNSDLKEGMYLEAKLTAKEAKNAITIARNLLQTNNKVYVVKAYAGMIVKAINNN